MIRGPGVPAGTSRDHLVTNADLAATFSEWAGAPPPPDMDGRSLAPLLGKKPPGPGEWRQSLPITLVLMLLAFGALIVLWLWRGR